MTATLGEALALGQAPNAIAELLPTALAELVEACGVPFDKLRERMVSGVAFSLVG